MNPWWQVATAAGAGLVLLWLGLVVTLYFYGRRHHSSPASTREVLRLLPDIVRLISRLARDPTLPGSVRLRLGLLLGYLVLPVDLIPDVIPVIGYADDAIIVALALRSVTRAAGPDAIARHWPGTLDGLRTLQRLTRT